MGRKPAGGGVYICALKHLRGIHMRQPVDTSTAESRVISKYRKLHTQLTSLLQSVQDLLPPGIQLNDKVTFTQQDGKVHIAFQAKPMQVVINDGTQQIRITLSDSRKLAKRASV
jgi:hypothetical protein